MARNFSTYLSKQVAEHLVVAELGRRGVIATPFAGNLPDIDIMAFAGGRTVCLQVKAIKSGEWSFQAKQFLEIAFEDGRQRVVGPRRDIDRNLICVFVRIGEQAGRDRLYIFRQGELQDLIMRRYSKFISGRDGVRARNPESTHTAVRESELEAYRNKWELIAGDLGDLSSLP